MSMPVDILEIESNPLKLTKTVKKIVRQYIVGSPTRIRSRLISGVFWTIMVTCLVQGSTVISSIITAHLTGFIEFGKVGIVYSVIATVAAFAAIGLGPTTTKFISELRTNDPDRAGKLLALCSIMSIITGILYSVALYIVAPWIANHMLHAEALTTQIRMGSIYVLIFAINSYQIGALCGFEAFARIARVSALEGPMIIVITVALTWPLALNGAVLSMVMTMLCSCYLYHKALRAECRRYNIRISYTNLYPELSSILHIAIPAAASGCLGGLATFSVNAMLVRQPSGFAQMAIFSAANCIRSLVRIVPSMLNRVSTPLLCNLLASRELSRYKRTFWTCLTINLVFSASMALILYLCAYPLLRLFGKQFPEGQGVFGLLLIGAVVESLAVSLYQQMYSHGRLWLQFVISFIWSAVLVVCTWLWITKGGAAALAASYLVAWLCTVALYALATRNMFDKTAVHNPL
jgi:O-antigen/teichoic acid export membrane protein